MGKVIKVVVVGGGFAGVKTAVELMNDPHFEVTLISPHSRFEYHGAMYRSATGRSPLEVVVPMREIFAKANNIRVVLDSMTEISPDSQTIVGETGDHYHYDVLVIGVGYVVNYFGIEGMAEHSNSMYSVQEAIALRHNLVGVFRSAKPDRPIYITAIGAGPTGVEIISDIKNFAKIVEGRHGLPNLDVRPTLIEAADRVLPIMSAESSKSALKRLKDIGVDVQLQTLVKSCRPKTLVTNKGEITSDVTIWTAGSKANPLFAAYPDLFSINQRGRVQVNDYFQSNNKHIYVIGDAADTTYSGMAQTAIHNAIALANNLKRAARKQRQMPYTPSRPAYVVPVGGEWAVLETEDDFKTGKDGWQARRDADRWVLNNFLVYDLADKHYKSGDRIANF